MNRDLTENQINIVLNELHEAIIEPEYLTNAIEAAKSIASYCKDPNAIIWIYADYDCDGICSGYIMKDGLKQVADCAVEVYYPERHEGYGIKMAFAEKLVESMKDADESIRVLVITVDNGIAAVEPIKYLKDNGIEVIVTDHHMAKDEVPDCLIVDPHNFDQPDTFKHLAGCGVAFKVVQLVQREFDYYGMEKYLPALAIGTVADVMPMTIENIALVKYGLEIINSNECPAGIQAIKDYMGKKELTANDLGWEIGPRINACGRMGNINLAAKVFFTDELDYGEDIEDVINKVERLNSERKDLSKKAEKMVSTLDFNNSSICFLDASEYPHGIIGIIANKVLEKYNKPTFILAQKDNEMVGSARSIPGINMQEVLRKEHEKGHLVEYGGHEVAAGLTIDKNNFEKVKQSINETVNGIQLEMPKTENVEAELIVDELIEITHINKATFDLINVVPYDNSDFSTPIFALIDVEVLGTSISSNNKNNIKFTLKDDTGRIEIWAWGMANLYDSLGQPKRIHMAGTIEKDFMKPNRFTLKVVDILKAE